MAKDEFDYSLVYRVRDVKTIDKQIQDCEEKIKSAKTEKDRDFYSERIRMMKQAKAQIWHKSS